MSILIRRMRIISSVLRRFILESASNDRALNGPLSQDVVVEPEVFYCWSRVELCELHRVEEHLPLVVLLILISFNGLKALDHVRRDGPPLDLRALVALQRHQAGPVQVAIGGLDFVVRGPIVAQVGVLLAYIVLAFRLLPHDQVPPDVRQPLHVVFISDCNLL